MIPFIITIIGLHCLTVKIDRELEFVSGISTVKCFCFTVVGCPDMSTPPGTRLVRNGNITTVECLLGTDTSSYQCDGREWVGSPPNCTGDLIPDERVKEIPPGKIEPA